MYCRSRQDKLEKAEGEPAVIGPSEKAGTLKEGEKRLQRS